MVKERTEKLKEKLNEISLKRKNDPITHSNVYKKNQINSGYDEIRESIEIGLLAPKSKLRPELIRSSYIS